MPVKAKAHGYCILVILESTAVLRIQTTVTYKIRRPSQQTAFVLLMVQDHSGVEYVPVSSGTESTRRRERSSHAYPPTNFL